MAASLPLFIGLRYFRRAAGDDRFLSLMSWFSLLGMLIGVVSLIVVTAVMNGFEHELQKRVLSVLPHAYIEGPEQKLEDWSQWRGQILGQEGLQAAAPYVGGKAMFSSGGRIQGAALYGIDPALEKGVSAVSENMLAGRYLGEEGGHYEIVLGDILARQLGLNIGDSLQVILPKVTVTPFGLFPRERAFTVVGVFSVGAQLDGTTAFIHLADAQKLYQLGDAVQGLRLQFDDMLRSAQGAATLLDRFPEGSQAIDWSVSQGSLFQAVKMEKLMVRLLLMFIVVIAAFNIVSILSMAVSSRRGAIAVLRTMGATPGTIMAIFVIYGLATGLSGVLGGLLIGLPLALYVGDVVAWFEQLSGLYVFDPQVYFISRIPSLLRLSDVLWVCGFGIGLSLLATLYPGRQAARVQPAEALRYE
ncbi:lipoprotein-releasing ABC transporter permease subunit [Spongiibacter tropicus]|uniref:lipoprotein-releasing ABC transporter permease subunit n=1 Tax=Spongiibacter tropicus TaxID=454602 RepID=UPI0035BE623F